MRRSVSSDVKTANYRLPGLLPQIRTAREDHVPVNKHGERLDYYLKRPSASDRQAYHERFSGQGDNKPCRWFYLADACKNGDNCPYDHSEISPNILGVMRYLVKRVPCIKGNECRRLDCIFGHVCANLRCITDDSDSCTLRKFHGVDPVFASWVRRWSAEDAAGSQADDAEDMPVESLWF
jgi:hypothetical protein